MKRSSYIGDCCAYLASKSEYLTDALLRAFVDGQSLSRTAEETLSQSDNLAWDSLSLGIDTECANLKADLAPLGLYSNGMRAFARGMVLPPGWRFDMFLFC